jgi:radical SAM superfamily enzyme YgiQ (UPF0313 family)
MFAMKIAFVFMGAESLGVEYLSAVARAAGHETRLFFDPAAFGGKLMLDSPALSRLLDRRAKIVRAMAAYAPDVAAFSCFTGNYRWSLDVARAFRAARPGTPVVFGGVHVSAVPERVIAEDCVDAALAGEGESVFIDLLESVTTGGGAVPGALIKRNGEVLSAPALPPLRDLDALPIPTNHFSTTKSRRWSGTT